MRRECLALLLSPFLITGLNFAHGQNPYHLNQMFHRTWTSADGAPALAYDEVQDDAGFLWISTSSGLYQFDGIHFTLFQSPAGEPSLQPQVYFLAKTRSGICGASVLSGVICIDHGHVTSYGTKEGLPASPARSLVSSLDGSLWLVAQKHLYHLRSGRWEKEDLGSAGEVTAVYFGQDGTQWLVRDNALFYRPSGQQTFQSAEAHWPKGTLLASFSEGPKSELCLTLLNNSKSSNVVRLDPPSDHATAPLSFTFPYEVRDCKFDSAGNLWAVGNGVDRITFNPTGGNGSTGKMTGTVEHLGADAGLSSLETHGATEDNQGNIWIISQRGLDVFRIPALVRAYPDSPQASTRPVVAAGREGQVWIGVGKTPLQERHGDQTQKHGKPFDFYYGLVSGADNTLWFDNGVSLFRMRGDKATAVKLPAGQMALLIRQIVPLPDKTLLVRYETSLWRMRDDLWTSYAPDPAISQVPSYLFFDTHGTLWRAYPSGLITDGSQKFEPTPSQHVVSIQLLAETSQGMLAADYSHIYFLQDGHLRQLRFADETIVTGTSGICEDANGDLWLNGGRGVLHVAREAFRAALLAPDSNVMGVDSINEPGLRGPTPTLYNTPTLLRDGFGRLWANTSDSIVFIDPRRALVRPVPPILSISTPSADGSLMRARTPDIPPGTNTIRIPYFGSSLGSPEKVRYRYQLEGREDWQDVGSRTEAVYTHLRPGSYSFVVSASNANGQWTAPARISFYVQPRLYQRVWFQVLLACLGLVLAWLLYRVQLHRAAVRMRERAEERANERLRIAQHLHDTLLQGFQGLMLAFHVAAQEIPKDNRVHQQVASSLARADRVMTEARDRIGKLRSPDYGTSLRQALETLNHERPNTAATVYRVEIHGAEYELDPFFEEEILLIAREAVSNSFRHARAKAISVELEYGSKSFRMVCRDDGRGFRQNGAHLGHYGLVGMGERAERLGATFQCQSSADAGTKIEICVRASKARPHKSLLVRAKTAVQRVWST